MAFYFSQNLIDKTISYFSRKYEVSINADEAQLYLESLVGLHEALSTKTANPPRNLAEERGGCFVGGLANYLTQYK